MLRATIVLEDNVDELEKLFSLEDKVFSNDRAKYEVKKKEGKFVIDVSAKDSVALRSVLTSITRVLTVNEKTGKVLEDE
jgi:tRNA threonylcarbamoyladenosine modification (KEOPS) complex  Pcc1 subunit